MLSHHVKQGRSTPDVAAAISSVWRLKLMSLGGEGRDVNSHV